ncbi:MAG: hypothetical protein JEY91_06805 [Spirochaetaceae bacterium]|nr:hypothetical protein [Spirochaetaceae bacterium]
MIKNKETFIEKLYECNQHRQKLLIASDRLKGIFPLNIKQYESLSIEDLSFIDQLVYRFSKLQDSMGEKIFPSLLELLGETVKNKSYIDKLNRLEELNLVDRIEWMSLRKDRNEIAHEYSFNKSEVVESLNLIFGSINQILNVYDHIYKYCLDKFDFVKKSTILKY